MSRRQYSDEFKEQVIYECQETGNVAIVAKHHEMSANTIHTWIGKYRKQGSVRAFLRKKADRTKELEPAILHEIKDLKNPQ